MTQVIQDQKQEQGAGKKNAGQNEKKLRNYLAHELIYQNMC